MPAVLPVGGYRFNFYSDESDEPPHGSVNRAGWSDAL
jgi:hypothetical protein